jgi:hypothetical protein
MPSDRQVWPYQRRVARNFGAREFNGRHATDSVEKLASKISRLLTSKILLATVRFGEPAGSDLRQTKLSWSSSSRVFRLFATLLSFSTESVGNGQFRDHADRAPITLCPQGRLA